MAVNRDPHHVHTYDEYGRMTCCTLEDKINEIVAHDHDHGHSHDHHASGTSNLRLFLPAIASAGLLLSAIALDNFVAKSFFADWLRLSWYVAAYDALKGISKGEIFTEFLLMSMATIGAFAIDEYPEGVAVMLFYAVGEIFQTLAVKRAKTNIKNLLDQRPDHVTIVNGNQMKTIHANQAKVGDLLQLKPGEKLGLDGELISDTASFNTAALTGESKPDTKRKGDTVLAGMINLNTVTLVRVTAVYSDSKLSRILELVQNATSQKAKTELFIRRFARYYTPAVTALAVLICVTPYFFLGDYIFREWLYRSLIFLVISCPCALVISIPLGYFGGIGAASRHGILFKGSNFLDIMANIQHVVLDKTGTLTKGVFKVQDVVVKSEFDQGEILKWVSALENKSTHPVATAIHEYVGAIGEAIQFEHVEEIPGRGLKGIFNGKELVVGNFKLLDQAAIQYDANPGLTHTTIVIAYDNKFVGYISISDEIKEDSSAAIKTLHAMKVKTTILSGDKSSVVKWVAKKLGIDHAFGDLLPDEKVIKVKGIRDRGETVAFAGDGVNDAPVIALSDVGIAMGGLGSDATIETADVVIQDDKPSKIPMAIRISKKTRQIVWQNITMAFVMKAVVLALGAGGLATMWEAVFADVGVALLAILNAVRIQRMEF
jgi:Zn2+/Cd2+-exporting ATPase